MNILIAIDFSEATQKIVNSAQTLVCKKDSTVWLLHAAMPDPDFVGYDVGPASEREFVAKKFREENQKLQDIADDMKKSGIDVTPLLIQGPTVETILEEAEKLPADAIIIGSHGRGAMHRLLVGSVSEALLHRSRIPLVIIPTKK